jgi:hypothetical protein
MVHSDPETLSLHSFQMTCLNVSFLFQMAGMMLLQISVMCAITELVIAILVLHWFITAHKIEEPSEESE